MVTSNGAITSFSQPEYNTQMGGIIGWFVGLSPVAYYLGTPMIHNCKRFFMFRNVQKQETINVPCVVRVLPKAITSVKQNAIVENLNCTWLD